MMAIFTKKDKNFDAEIERILRTMANMDPDSEEYAKLVATLDVLTKTSGAAKRKVSPDTVAIIAANIIGIGLILCFEKEGFIGSKALGFVLRGRV